MCREYGPLLKMDLCLFSTTQTFAIMNKKSSVFGYILVDTTYGHLHNEVLSDATHPKVQGQFKHLTDQIAYTI
jgi:hypothetical protein